MNGIGSVEAASDKNGKTDLRRIIDFFVKEAS